MTELELIQEAFTTFIPSASALWEAVTQNQRSFDKISEVAAGLFVRLFRRGRLGEFLETRIISERIEHRIEPEQCGSERYDSRQRASVRYRE
jgi:hypothetical protein